MKELFDQRVATASTKDLVEYTESQSRLGRADESLTRFRVAFPLTRDLQTFLRKCVRACRLSVDGPTNDSIKNSIAGTHATVG
ncbi:hypothetical protein RRSWK_04320 [Rhodopirellula sp. SWK7]|nr:hypothetical protein RRSWK_04320 [Rhodopirellula sp. SWK7]